MNRTLSALSTKLKWQSNEITQALLSIEQQLTILEQKFNDNQQKISNSCTIPAFILPELEIARVHFVTQQEHHQHELKIKKTALVADQNAFKLQQTRLNTEMKMLEKHQEAKLKTQQQQTLLTQQNNNDEWTLQRRESK